MKYYIKIDTNNNIIGFINEGKANIEKDVFYKEYESGLLGLAELYEELGVYKEAEKYSKYLEHKVPLFKYENGEIREATDEEKQTYLDSLPKPPKSEIELLKEQLELTQTAMNELILGGM